MSLLFVPVEGPTEMIPFDDVDAAQQLSSRGVPHLVNVDLNRDGVRMGRVMFSLDTDLARNERATRWTGLLTGSYVAVNGLAAFEVHEETGYDLMFDRLTEPAPDAPRTLRKARGETGF